MPSTSMIASPAWRTRAWLFALLAVASGPALRAQTLYEWREPNGTVVYSQLAPLLKEGAATRAIHLHDLTGPERATAVRVAAQSLPVAPPDQWPLALADARVGRAVSSLQRAEQALRSGQSPKPGERRHLVNGHSRLTRAYFDRISSSEAEVARARAELQAAYAERDGLIP